MPKAISGPEIIFIPQAVKTIMGSSDTFQPEIALVVFENSWSEVDWILPVLFQLKAVRDDICIVTVFSPRWIHNDEHRKNNILKVLLDQIADYQIQLDSNQASIPIVNRPNQVRLIIKDIFCVDYGDLDRRLREEFPAALTVAHPHGNALLLLQEYNRMRNFNWWDPYVSHHDLLLVDHEVSLPRYFDRISSAKIAVVGIPRLDQWWINRLLDDPSLATSPEGKRTETARRVFLFIVRGVDEDYRGEFPMEVFQYVVASVARIVLGEPGNHLLIKPHPNQDVAQLAEALKEYDRSRWSISSRHIMQLAHLSDFVISVNSSTILDCLAMKKPVVEFHPQIRPTYATCIDRYGQIRSAFGLLGLVPSMRTKEELDETIRTYFGERRCTPAWQMQHRRFDRYFPRTANASLTAVENILNLLGPREKNNGASSRPVWRSGSLVTGERRLFFTDTDGKGNQHLQMTLKRIHSHAQSVSSIALKELAMGFGLENLVVTGSFNEHLIGQAAKIFSAVYVIEVASDLYQPASFASFASLNNCFVYHSANILKEVLHKIRGKTLFFLGTHEGSHITLRSKTNTPIIEELRAIRSCGPLDGVILLGNLRYFQPVRTGLDGIEATQSRLYPTLQEAVDVIHQMNPAYLFWVMGDTALAYPPGENVSVSRGIQAMTISRLFADNRQGISQVIAAERRIAFDLPKNERETIAAFRSDFEFVEESGVGAHYRLWNGLVKFGEKKYSDARMEFEQAVHLGIDHWRIKWYLALATHYSGDTAAGSKTLGSVVARMSDSNETPTAEQVDRWFMKKHGVLHSALCSEFLESVPKKSRVLGIGSRIGGILGQLSNMGFDAVTGLENKPEFDVLSPFLAWRQPVEIEIQSYKNVRLVYDCRQNVPYPDNSFDMVFTHLACQGIHPDKLDRTIDELCRVSKRFIWVFEYYHETSLEISDPNQGRRLWKRDYLSQWMNRFPDLRLTKHRRIPYLCNSNTNTMFLLEKTK